MTALSTRLTPVLERRSSTVGIVSVGPAARKLTAACRRALAHETADKYLWAMPPAATRIHVLALRGCTAFVPLGYADLLRKSAAFAPERRLEVTLVSTTERRVVDGAGGLRVTCDVTLAEAGPCDLVLVPPVDPDVPANLELNRAAVPWLKRRALAGAHVASACTGAFLVAEAGLLDRKAATTHWAFQGLFAQRYPRVRLQPEAIVVDQGRVITAGGATSFLNLTLHVVERLLGPDAARSASRMFLIDPNKAPQSAYAVFGTQKTHGDDEILRAQEIIEREVESAPSVDVLARRVAMSRRNFVRRFTAVTGNSPRTYAQRVRVEAARRALESSRHPVSEIAARVGYADVVAFRRLFAKITGLTPADYRARYGRAVTPAAPQARRAARA